MNTQEILQNAEISDEGGVKLTGEEIAIICDEHNFAFDMVLPCPNCGLVHVDAPDPESCKNCGQRGQCTDECAKFEPWTNPLHKKHRCANCNHVWKPYPFNTNGVAELKES